MAVIIGYLVAACASIGHPEGGPIDELPPVFVRSNPAPGAVNVNHQRIIIEFDENVQIKDAMNSVVVSPPPASFPKVTAIGRSVRVELADSLLPNTTYTIDFTNGISDLNEGNELDGFALDFSTGETLDSLCISGMVLEAETLEPAQGMTVGVYSNLSDTAISTLPFERVTRTNQLGQFTVRNLAPGTYRIYAVNDVNHDNHWDRSEDVAFLPFTLSPTSEPTTVADTLKDASGADSIVIRPATAFYPNDVLLTWFNENYKSQYLSKYERSDRKKIHLEMGTVATELPQITIVGGKFDGCDMADFTVLNASATLDTLDYWITNEEIYNSDSLRLAMRYLRTDTLDQLSYTTDTLQFNLRAKKNKKKNKSDVADTAATDSVVIPPLKLSSGPGTLDVYSPLLLKFDTPLLRAPDSTGVHLAIKVDSLWETVATPVFTLADSLHPLVYTASYTWEPGASYQLTVDSLTLEDLYGSQNAAYTYKFDVRALNEYSTITFNIEGVDSAAYVLQMLSEQDKPVRTVTGRGNGPMMIRYLTPGNYYARLVIDSNNNGKFDGGSLTDNVMPEDTYYFPKRIQLRKNWDIDQPWNITETPVDQQKPMEIKKNKPKTKPEQDTPYGTEEEDQYYDEFGNPAVDPDDPFGKRKSQRDANLNNRGRPGNAGYRSPNGMRR